MLSADREKLKQNEKIMAEYGNEENDGYLRW